MLSDTISVLDGNTFVVSDRWGDLDASPTNAHGLFHEDTRYLSRLRLTVNGQTLTVLSTDDVAYHTAQFFLVLPTSSVGDDPPISIIRKRTIKHGFIDHLSILNHHSEPITLTLRIDIDADFADLFEVKDQLAKTGNLDRDRHDDRLVLGYRRDSYLRETTITTSHDDAIVTDDGIQLEAALEPHDQWETDITVAITHDIQGRVAPDSDPGVSNHRSAQDRRDDLTDWLDEAPIVTSDWLTVEETYRRSMIDLAALRLPAYAPSGAVVPAAGLPWFMCLFGRDSLITSYQALPFVPHFAESTLRLLAMLQAKATDDFRDAEPGKIMHELRSGELTAFEQRPHSPYYGAADATPLFLVLLDEYERWTGDEALVHQLESEARAALGWIDDYGDLDGDGYVEYRSRNPETGLVNQCWKEAAQQIEAARDRQQQWLEGLADIRTHILDDAPLRDALQLVCRHAAGLVAADMAAIGAPDPERALIDLTAMQGGLYDHLDDPRIPIGPGLRTVLETKEPAIFEDGPPEGAAAFITAEVGPTIVIPLTTDGDPAGVLVLARNPGEPAFVDDDLQLIESFAHQANNALDRARPRDDRQRLVVLEDRERLARDLHDLVIQRLFAAGMGLQSFQPLIADPTATERVDATVTAQLDDIISHAEQSLGFRPTLTISGDPETIAGRVAEQLLPTLTEALSNVARHANATTTDINITTGDLVQLDVVDDGDGYHPPTGNTAGNGLSNLHDRAQRLDGAMTIAANHDQGTTFTWTASN